MANHQGYFDHCRKNCVKSTQDWSLLEEQLGQLYETLDMQAVLAKRFDSVHFHHIPKIALAGCPNGCSRPQIKDIGVVGYAKPEMTERVCSGCGECLSVCLEGALSWNQGEIALDTNRCLSCGDCIRVCPTGRISQAEAGWQIYTGGRLGRHPRLGELAGKEPSQEDVLARVRQLLVDYQEEGLKGERFSSFLTRKNQNKG